MAEQGDRALIEEARGGSARAFEEIMKRYQRLVYAACLTYAGTSEDALDMTQEVFVKVYENLGSFRGTGTFRAWLLRIVHNDGLNWIRRCARRGDHCELTPANSPQLDPAQDSDLLQEQTRDMLREAMVHLNPRQRQAVMLRYFESTSIGEIASILGCTDGTAKNVLFRGLRKIRDHIVPQWRES